MTRRPYVIPLPDGRELRLGGRTLVMGVLNVTPDSFSDGGGLTDVAAIVDVAARMVEEGADILDIGGESTRPGAVPVAEEIEAARVVPVLRALTVVAVYRIGLFPPAKKYWVLEQVRHIERTIQAVARR